MTVFDRLRLDGRRALVTGASRGLGFEMAKALAEAGADLVITGREPQTLVEAAEALRPLGGDVQALEADLSTPAGAERLCQWVLDDFGPIEILVNNVGGRRINVPTEQLAVDEWQRIIDLNLTQAFVCTKLVGGAMLPRGHGRVINVASISAFVAGRPMRGRSYETAKAALTMFTKAVAVDWAPHGVTVNAIAPGAFLTDANRRWFAEHPDLRQEIEATIPLGRLGNPDELGPLVVYLASDASSFMTGSVLVIDGGRMAC